MLWFLTQKSSVEFRSYIKVIDPNIALYKQLFIKYFYEIIQLDLKLNPT